MTIFYQLKLAGVRSKNIFIGTDAIRTGIGPLVRDDASADGQTAVTQETAYATTKTFRTHVLELDEDAVVVAVIEIELRRRFAKRGK